MYILRHRVFGVSMNVGVDFHGTLTGSSNRSALYQMLNDLLPRNTIHVISHAFVKNVAQTEGIIKIQGFPFTSINVIGSDDYDAVPQLKLELCQKLDIHLFIDDRLDTCELIAKHGVLTLNIL